MSTEQRVTRATQLKRATREAILCAFLFLCQLITSQLDRCSQWILDTTGLGHVVRYIEYEKARMDWAREKRAMEPQEPAGLITVRNFFLFWLIAAVLAFSFMHASSYVDEHGMPPLALRERGQKWAHTGSLSL